MMRVDSVSPTPDRASRYLVKFSDGSTMRLYRMTVEEFSLYPGKELEEQELSQLRTAAGQMSAKMRAVRIVSASNVSQQDLERRLVQKGETPQQAREAVAWMSELQLIDDRRTAQQIVSHCAARGYGLGRAKQALYEKRIPKEYWEEALAEYPDQQEAITAFLQSRLQDGADSREVKRAVDALLRRGHSYSQIQRCLRSLSLHEDTIAEE